MVTTALSRGLNIPASDGVNLGGNQMASGENRIFGNMRGSRMPAYPENMNGELVCGGQPRAIQALRNVSVHVSAGEIVTLLGANGAGKSTLLKIISGIHIPAKGRLWFGGQNITGLPRSNAFSTWV